MPDAQYILLLLLMCAGGGILYAWVTMYQRKPEPPSEADIEEMLQEAVRLMNYKDFKGAIRLTQQINAARPMARAYYLSGCAREELGDLSGALKDLNRSIAMEDDIRVSRLRRGWLRLSSGDSAGAVEDFDTVVESEKEADGKNCQALGLALFCAGGNDEEALYYMDKARGSEEFAGANMYIEYRLWSILAGLGRQREILEEMKVTVAAEEKRTLAEYYEQYEYIKKCFAEMGKPVDESGPDLKPKTDWHVLLGHYLTGQLSESDLLAKANAETNAETKQEHLCEAHYQIGMYYAGAGSQHKEKARMHLQKAADTRVAFKDCWAARARLKLL
ncbi:MAG: hypothetical protein ACAI35_13040 [Candidatus Methylacidiphilales bacterium]|nr:hypothetical protein [Candidatus Methylacidiphilales bacterium]